MLQAMMLQTHGDGVRQDVLEFEERLRLLGELLEEWHACQVMWINLSSVLGAEVPPARIESIGMPAKQP